MKESLEILNHSYPLQHSISVERTNFLSPEQEIILTHKNNIKFVSLTNQEWSQFMKFLADGEFE